jgi:hypothetical protein
VVQGSICSFVIGSLLFSAFASGCVAAEDASDVQNPDKSEDMSGGQGGVGGFGETGGNLGSTNPGSTGGSPVTAVPIRMDAAANSMGGASPPPADAMPPDVRPASGVSTLVDEKVAWNGDGVGNGSSTQWMGRGQEGKTTLSYSDAQSFSSKHSVAFSMSNIGYAEFGWGIAAMPANKYKKIGFWANLMAQPGKSAPGSAYFTLKVGGGYAAPGGGRGVRTVSYNKTGLKGGWQQIVIPIADVVGTPSGATITEILLGLEGCSSSNCAFTLYVDDIAYGN